jgi:hypothetical protein
MNPSLSPNFWELDEYAFQNLCCDLFATGPGIGTCDVYGKRGQRQQGIDLLARRQKSSDIEVGQCKCYQDITASQITEASDEFFKHIEHWREQKVKRFVLFVACDLDDTKQQKAIQEEIKRFEAHNIVCEAWSATKLRQELAPHPDIVSRYIRSQDIVENICGSAAELQPLTKLRYAQAQLEVRDSEIESLSTGLSLEIEQTLERQRELYRTGKKRSAQSHIRGLLADSNWGSISHVVRAQVLKFLATCALNLDNNVTEATTLLNQALNLDPNIDISMLEALLDLSKNDEEAALEKLANAHSLEAFNFYIGLLLQLNKYSEALAKLEHIPDAIISNIETERLHALALLAIGNIDVAQEKIHHAIKQKPSWETIQVAEAIIYYYASLSPIARPHGIVPWPEPVNLKLVKSDEQSVNNLRKAAQIFSTLAEQTESRTQRDIYKAWYLACLANDSEHQTAAADCCSNMLEKNPSDPRALIWAIARSYEVDLDVSKQALIIITEDSKDYFNQVIALLLINVKFGLAQDALNLLQRTKEAFENQEAKDIWLLWMVRALLANSDMKQALEVSKCISNASTSDLLQIIVLQETAKQSDNWEPLSTKLEECYKESGKGQYLYELCQLKYRLKEWPYIADLADELVKATNTSDALWLAAESCFRAGRSSKCLNLLDNYKEFFKGGVLPSNLHWLKVACQEKQGLIPQALSAAEVLSIQDSSTESLLNYFGLQQRVGDHQGLIGTALKLAEREGIEPHISLHIAQSIMSEAPELAHQFWQNSLDKGSNNPTILPQLLEVGFALGVDREYENIEPLIRQAQQFAVKQEGSFRTLDIKERISMLRVQDEDLNFAEQKYIEGSIPIHLFIDRFDISLTRIFLNITTTNENRQDLLNQRPVLARHGGRSIKEQADQIDKWRLHMDITALLLAKNLGILSKVENLFSPIWVSSALPVALNREHKLLSPQKPTQIELQRRVVELFKKGKLKETERHINDDEENEISQQTSLHWLSILKQAKAANGYLVDHLPLESHGPEPQLFDLPIQDGSFIINCYSLFKALKGLSIPAYAEAQKQLSANGHGDLGTTIPTLNTHIFLTSGVVDVLSRTNLLEKVCKNFKIYVDYKYLDDANQAIIEFENLKQLQLWIRELTTHISIGLRSGMYKLITLVDDESKFGEKPCSQTLIDLFRYTSQSDDILWIDDRFCNQYLNRDYVPIIGILEILTELRKRGALTETEYYNKIHLLRTANIRYIPLTSEEIIYRLRQVSVLITSDDETEELTTLRKYLASCLLDVKCLQMQSIPESAANPHGEMMFLLECLQSVREAIINGFAEPNLEEGIAQTRANWILDSLYTGLFGVKHLIASAEYEDGINLLSSDIVSLYARGISLINISNDATQSHLKKYFKWLEDSILNSRLKADPRIAEICSLQLHQILLEHMRVISNENQSLQKYTRISLNQLYLNLPEALRKESIYTQELLQQLGIETIDSVSFESITFIAEDFFKAVAKVVNGQEATAIAKNPNVEFTFKQLQSQTAIFEIRNNQDSSTHRLMDKTWNLLSDDLQVRQRTLRENHKWFDCDSKTFAQITNEIAELQDLQKQVELVDTWRKESATNFYETLQKKVEQDRALSLDELMPSCILGLLRHFRLNPSESEQELPVSLNSAAQSLFETEGLKTALERLTCLPVKLPNYLIDQIKKLQSSERLELLQEFAASLGSPLCKVHLVGLTLRFADDGEAMLEIARKTIDTLCDDIEGEAHYQLFRILLMWTSKAFGYSSESKSWSVSIRLLMIWAHASKLHNLFHRVGASPINVIDFLESVQLPISADLFDRDPNLWGDVLNPHNLTRMELIVHGLGAVSKGINKSILESTNIIDKVKNFAVILLDENQIPHHHLLHDPLLSSDSAQSLLYEDRGEYLIPFLGEQLGQSLLSTQLKSLVEKSLDSLLDDPISYKNWLLLNILLRNQPIYSEFQVNFKRVFEEIDIPSLVYTNPETAFDALCVLTLQIGNINDDEFRHRMEKKIISISIMLSQEQGTVNEKEKFENLIMEFILNYSVKYNAPEESIMNFTNLLNKVFSVWPQFAENYGYGLSKMLWELPVKQLNGLWPVFLRLRAIRENN